MASSSGTHSCRPPSLRRAPRLNETVDVYWPECERYFRGTLVKRNTSRMFVFHILYEDDDYVETDLNEVQWHRARGSYTSRRRCCDEPQETMLENDIMPGDLDAMWKKKKNISCKREEEENIRIGEYTWGYDDANGGVDNLRKRTRTNAKGQTKKQSRQKEQSGSTEPLNEGPRELTEPAKLHWKKLHLREYMWTDGT